MSLDFASTNFIAKNKQAFLLWNLMKLLHLSFNKKQIIREKIVPLNSKTRY